MDGSAASAPLPGTPGGGTTGATTVGLPATELAARVRSGQLSAVDVVRAHLAHLAEFDARIGAFRVGRLPLGAVDLGVGPRRAPGTGDAAGPGREGLPSSAQFVGPAGSATRLLWLAGELERRLPWRRHAPIFDPAAPEGVPVG